MKRMNDIHKELRRIRRAATLTQEQLSVLIDLDQTTISAVEVGKRATTTDVLKLWVRHCEATLRFYARGEAPDPLMALSPTVRSVVELVRDLPEEDIQRIQELSSIFRRIEGVPRELMRAQLDGPLCFFRKSVSSEEETSEPRQRRAASSST